MVMKMSNKQDLLQKQLNDNLILVIVRVYAGKEFHQYSFAPESGDPAVASLFGVSSPRNKVDLHIMV